MYEVPNFDNDQWSFLLTISDMATVDACWKDFLLNQFHDVLPGSCIEFVAQDAWKYYEKLFTSLMELRSQYNARIVGLAGNNRAVYNCLPWQTKSVIFMKPPVAPVVGPNVQEVILDPTEEFENQGEGRFRVPNTFYAALVTMRPSGYSLFVDEVTSVPVAFQCMYL